jgi:N-acetyl sugar amidotransferase
MSLKDYKQCVRCVMDTSDPDISFNEQGYCNHCINYFENLSKRTYQGTKSDEELHLLINKIKSAGKNNKYDCVVGISGGVDSTYTAYLAKKMGLRVLGVHMDNGWNSEAAVRNIKIIVEKLGIDYESFVLDWEQFKDLQLSFLKASVPEAETPTDVAILAALHKIAAKHNIKYILSGGNFVTEGILPKTWHYDAKDFKYLKNIHKKFGNVSLRNFPSFSFLKEIYYKYVKGIKMIYFLNYIPFSKLAAIQVLADDLSWKNYGGKHHESLYTGFIQSYYLPVKFGIDYRRATFSSQICSGEMSREEAISLLTLKSYDEAKTENEINFICKKLNIELSEFKSILSLEPKTYRNYPNNEVLLNFIYNTYLRLNKRLS